MGLSLGVKQGARIKIGKAATLEVLKVEKKKVEVAVSSVLHSPDEVSTELFSIVDTERKEILPTVYCQLGKVDEHGGQSYNRLVFEAPRSVKIDRLSEEQ